MVSPQARVSASTRVMGCETVAGEMVKTATATASGALLATTNRLNIVMASVCRSRHTAGDTHPGMGVHTDTAWSILRRGWKHRPPDQRHRVQRRHPVIAQEKETP